MTDRCAAPTEAGLTCKRDRTQLCGSEGEGSGIADESHEDGEGGAQRRSSVELARVAMREASTTTAAAAVKERGTRSGRGDHAHRCIFVAALNRSKPKDQINEGAGQSTMRQRSMGSLKLLLCV